MHFSFTHRFIPIALAAIGASCLVISARAQNFVGGGNAPTFDTTSAVSLLDDSGEAGGRLIIDTIDGNGMNSKTTHENASANPPAFPSPDPFGRQGLFRGNSHNNPGTVVGSNWAKFGFDQVYNLSNIWIWNWNEDGGGGGDQTKTGWKHITVQYSLTGGSNPAEWTTADLLLGAAGDNLVPEASGSNNEPANLIAPFSSTGPVMAKYVVMTNTGTGNEITYGGDDGAGDAGLAEVRFEIVPEPASLSLLTLSAVTLIRRRR